MIVQYKKSLKEKISDSLQLQKIIIKDIEAGNLLPGERLLSERALADMYGMSRRTVQRALRQLATEGYIYRQRGAGTFVKQKSVVKMDLSYLSDLGNAGISAIMKSYGVKVSSKVLTKGCVSTRFFCHKLGLPEDKEVYVLHRIRYGNDEPIAVEYTYLPAALFQNIDELDFSRISLYDYMDSVGHMPKKFRQKLQIVEINERERAYLELHRNDPIYYLEFIGYDDNGIVVEYTESYARCDKFEFKFNNQV